MGYFQTTLTILGLLLLNSSAFGGNLVTVYFVPLEIETYIPITKATITCEAREKWTISEESQVTKLINLLSPDDRASFDGNRVRIKLSFDKQIYYIDSEGVVKRGKRSFRIDKVELGKFAETLKADQREVIKRHSCDPKEIPKRQ